MEVSLAVSHDWMHSVGAESSNARVIDRNEERSAQFVLARIVIVLHGTRHNSSTQVCFDFGMEWKWKRPQVILGGNRLH